MEFNIKERFLDAYRTVIECEEPNSGIGTLSEKSMHKIIKYYIEPRKEFHEIEFRGKICDVKNEQGIFEIQTRSLEKLIKKLPIFLSDSVVTIVFPLAYEKRIRWLDKKTGELSDFRKSPRKEGIYEAFRELYKIRKILSSDNIRIKFLFLKTEEYRYKNGWDKTGKRGSVRIERIPTEILSEVDISSVRDYKKYIPSELDGEFTVKEFIFASGCSPKCASYVIGLFSFLGIIEHTSNRGRAYLYKNKFM